MQSLEQIRAQHAFAKAAEISISGDKDSFLSLARSLPAMLQGNGLLATWAFLLAKDSSEHKKVRQALFQHLCVTMHVPENLTDRTVFTEFFISENHFNCCLLRQFTEEALKYSGWLKRGAEALCDEGRGEQ